MALESGEKDHLGASEQETRTEREYTPLDSSHMYTKGYGIKRISKNSETNMTIIIIDCPHNTNHRFYIYQVNGVMRLSSWV